MNIQYTFKGMEQWEEARVKEYADQKAGSVEKLLSHVHHDEAHLEIRAERFDKNNAYEIELAMNVLGKVMLGKEASHSIEKAIDLAKDRFIKQLRRHGEVLKNKGKTNSGLKRTIKQISENREHGALYLEDEGIYESTLSSDVESKPINTF